MSIKRQQRSSKFKFQVALEAAKGVKTINQLASEHHLNPGQVSQWKGQLMERGSVLFETGGNRDEKGESKQEAALYEQIGRLKMELEWLKKKLPDSVEAKRELIEANHTSLSIRRQCELVGLSRASYYYEATQESELNLKLMRLIDEQYTQTPFYGWPRMMAHLKRQGYKINHKRVQRLMNQMGLEAIYPKRRTTLPAKGHKIYPYLLRGLDIVHPNQVWSTDITYLPMPKGFMYLVAVMDWFSRYVLTWQLSNTLDSRFCLLALQQALLKATPTIFNTDQGAQFTATTFTTTLENAGIRISMDGRGRAFDNIFNERLWRSGKYECVYFHEFATVPSLEAGLDDYFTFYNHARPHQSLAYATPAEVHYGRLAPHLVN